MCLMRAIEADELRPGTRLPTQRALAFDLGLSVQTVSRAYEQLTRLGFITGQVGRGSFVAARQTEASLPWWHPAGSDAMIDCGMLTPVMGPPQAAAMARTLGAMSTDIGEGGLHGVRGSVGVDASGRGRGGRGRCGRACSTRATRTISFWR